MKHKGNLEVNGKQYILGVGGYNGSNPSSATDIATFINNIQSSGGYDGSDSGSSSSGVEALRTVTHDELMNLRDVSMLTPGQQYRIIDYVTTTTQDRTRSEGKHFDIIVTADSDHTLNENARATWNDMEGYFDSCNLSAWEIKYCIDNDRGRFRWADSSNGKGVIYYMKDEYGNECPYDFKNIQFENLDMEWCYTFGGRSDRTIPSSREVFTNNVIGSNYLKNDNNALSIPVNMFYGDSDNASKCNKLGNCCTGNFFDYNCCYNTLGDYCCDNEFYADCGFNTLGNGCNSNIFDRECCGNNFANDCYENSLGVMSCNNTFMSECYENKLADQNSYNLFESKCYSNELGNYCQHNTFGSCCVSNTFIRDCQKNTLGNSCSSNEFDSTCYYNSLGNACGHNTFSYSCMSNSLGNSCGSNKFESECYDNSLGNSCYGNKFESECYDNSLGNGCQINTLYQFCESNSFMNDCTGNLLYDGCIHNSFGNKCLNNTIGGIPFGRFKCRVCGYEFESDDVTAPNTCPHCNSNNSFETLVLGINGQAHNNKFGNCCCHNNLGENTSNNSFGNNCCENYLRTSCGSNSFGNTCGNIRLYISSYYNSFGDCCDSIIVGAYCYNNTFGNNCDSIIFGTSNTTGEKNANSYYENITVDSGNANIYIYSTKSLTSTNKLLNVRIALGYNNSGSFKFIPISYTNQSFSTVYGRDQNGNEKITYGV